MNNNLALCGLTLDRATTLRKDSTWLTQKVNDFNSVFYYFWRGKFLFNDLKVVEANQRMAHVQKLMPLLINAPSITFLGLENTIAHFAYDLSSYDESQLLNQLALTNLESSKFIDFRSSLSLLEPSVAAVLSYAKSLIHWQHSAKYCGYCASLNTLKDGGHRQMCSNNDCARESFPRTDAAVIMLVEYQPKTGPAVCLLAEHHRAPANSYSTLAGFVDPGESLTETVRREVFEEAGIKVDKVTYIDSQPWPFPHSLMVGFIAKATSYDIVLEEEELRHAAWFTAEQLRQFGEWGEESDRFKMPRKESISRLLIDKWIKSQIAE